MSDVYHSALKPELETKDELNHYTSNGSWCRAHNVIYGPLPEFYYADAIYSEPAWRQGYRIFTERAGIVTDPGQYKRYLESIRGVILTLEIPSYLVVGKHMIKLLKPHTLQNIKLHGYPCHLASWFAPQLDSIRHSEEILPVLAKQYTRILDFCCGYGNTARIMTAAGKRFVCTDINCKCIAHIARTCMGWVP